jgi:hypothetical protein
MWHRVEHTEFHVERKGNEWWVMSKTPGLPGAHPVGQRFVQMQFGPVLKVVHPEEASAIREMEWLEEHRRKTSKQRGKFSRRRKRATSSTT